MLPPNSTIGFDPFLFTTDIINKRTSYLKENHIILKPIEQNLVDLIWSNKPKGGEEKVWLHGIEWTGKTSSEKIQELKAKLPTDKECYFLTAKLDEIACNLFL